MSLNYEKELTEDNEGNFVNSFASVIGIGICFSGQRPSAGTSKVIQRRRREKRRQSKKKGCNKIS